MELAVQLATESKIAHSVPIAEHSQTQVVHGTVLDRHSDAPLEGAVVQLVGAGLERGAAVTRTDAEGRFELIAPRSVAPWARVLVSSERHVPIDRQITRAPHLWPDPLPAFLLTEGIPVHGRVIDAQGEPVAGATLCAWTGTYMVRSGSATSFRNAATQFVQLERSRDDGTFRAVLPAGTAWIAARTGARGGAVEISLPARSPAEIHVVISAEHQIAGRVIDESSHPVAEARLLVIPGRGARLPGIPTYPWSRIELETDRDGRFHFASLGVPMTYSISHPEHLPHYGGAADELLPGVEKTITLSRSRTLRGRLVSAGGPLPPEVTAYLSIGQVVRGSVTADSFEFFQVSPEASEGTLHVPGYRDIVLSWIPGLEAVDLGELILDPGLALSVSVTDHDGSPVENAGVRSVDSSVAAERMVRTDDSGNSTIEGLSPGFLDLEVWADGFVLAKTELEVRAPETNHEVSLLRAGGLRGVLVDSMGQPIAGAGVHANPQYGGVHLGLPFPDLPQSATESDLTDEWGRFRIPQVPIGVPVSLWIRPGQSLPTSLEIDALVEGEIRDLGSIAIGESSSLAAIVVDTAGRSIVGAAVEVRRSASTTGNEGIVLRTDTGGVAQIVQLASGSYSVIASAAGFGAVEETIELQSGHREVHCAMAAGAQWDVRVRERDGNPVVGAHVMVSSTVGAGSSDGTTDAEGRAGLGGISGGPLHYSVDSHQHAPLRGQCQSADQLPEELVLEVAATVLVRLLPPPGGPPIRRGSVHVDQEGNGWGFEFDRRMPVISVPGRAPGSARVEVLAEGYPRMTETVELFAGEVTEVLYQPEGPAESFAIQVLDGRGNAVTNARVRVTTHADLSLSLLQASALEVLPHCGDGVHSSDIAAPGKRFDVLIEADGFAPTAQMGVAPSNAPVPIELRTESGIDLTVVDSGGAAVAGRTVQIMLLDIRTLVAYATTRVRLVTDDDGRVLVRGLAPLRYNYNIENGVTGPFELAPEEILEMTVRLPGSIEVSGTILENGNPVPGGRLGVSAGGAGSNLAVDSNGRFRGDVPESDRAEFSFSGQDGQSIRFEEVPTVRGEEIRLDYPAIAAEIHLIDERGAPVGPVEQLRVGTTLPGGIRASTDLAFGADGIASIRHHPPGRCTMRGQLPDGLVLIDTSLELADGGVITARVHSSRVLRVRFPDGMRRDVHRVDAQGEFHRLPWAREQSVDGLTAYWLPIGEEGRTLVLDCRGCAPVVWTGGVQLPEDPIEVPDLPGGRIQVPWDDARGDGTFLLRLDRLDLPALPAPLSRRIWRGGDLDHPLPVGRYRVTVERAPGEELASSEVEVRAGETTAVEW